MMISATNTPISAITIISDQHVQLVLRSSIHDFNETVITQYMNQLNSRY